MWNGNPSLRIWRVGTKRILGVREGMPIPRNLEEQFDSFWNEVFGDFLVCPLTEPKPGHMQMMCVESANNLAVKRESAR